ncbi:hypothetical protein A6R73_03840 [Xanthomonas translucens pv. poae]|uniref:Tyr recombinase domain-containing protein n=1 Tax=Xanthomonas graminis pv. poae TaxID=227946 RepID=A0A199P030_9XANT|nr:hypothetical protein A6R73_03840 [Xanthomonas translucens pv. poae]
MGTPAAGSRQPAAAQRLRVVLDFAYATGLRASALVGARLGMIDDDAKGERWLHLVSALDRYLVLPGVMRHTHATRALECGADLTAVRDKLRHASLSTHVRLPAHRPAKAAPAARGRFCEQGAKAGHTLAVRKKRV